MEDKVTQKRLWNPELALDEKQIFKARCDAHQRGRFSRVRLFATLMDCSPPGSSVHGILQARLLEWVVISYSRGSSQHRDQTRIFCVSCIGKQIVYLSQIVLHRVPWEAPKLLVCQYLLLARCHRNIRLWETSTFSSCLGDIQIIALKVFRIKSLVAFICGAHLHVTEQTLLAVITGLESSHLAGNASTYLAVYPFPESLMGGDY